MNVDMGHFKLFKQTTNAVDFQERTTFPEVQSEAHFQPISAASVGVIKHASTIQQPASFHLRNTAGE